MTDKQQPLSTSARAWQHIAAERFDEAEPLVRECISAADPSDHEQLWHLFSWLASVLNSLSRHSEAEAMLRVSLEQALAIGPSAAEVGVARYLLANQLLLFGDPADALAETDPIPSGVGHVECLLHSIAAQALARLGRPAHARQAAQNALDAAPTAERRGTLADELSSLLNAD